MESIYRFVQEAAKKKVLFLPHAVRQMTQADRMISPKDVGSVIERGELVEDYPDDPRGHSCLLSGKDEKSRPIHVICAPKDEYLAIITAYVPSSAEWEDNFRKRRKT